MSYHRLPESHARTSDRYDAGHDRYPDPCVAGQGPHSRPMSQAPRDFSKILHSAYDNRLSEHMYPDERQRGKPSAEEDVPRERRPIPEAAHVPQGDHWRSNMGRTWPSTSHQAYVERPQVSYRRGGSRGIPRVPRPHEESEGHVNHKYSSSNPSSSDHDAASPGAWALPATSRMFSSS
jgi:hypothetical protein